MCDVAGLQLLCQTKGLDSFLTIYHPGFRAGGPPLKQELPISVIKASCSPNGGIKRAPASSGSRTPTGGPDAHANGCFCSCVCVVCVRACVPRDAQRYYCLAPEGVSCPCGLLLSSKAPRMSWLALQKQKGLEMLSFEPRAKPRAKPGPRNVDRENCAAAPSRSVFSLIVCLQLNE